MSDVMGWPYSCLYNSAYMQVENPFVESVQSLQQAEDSPLAATEIGHLPVRPAASFPKKVHFVHYKFQVPQGVIALLAVELQVLPVR